MSPIKIKLIDGLTVSAHIDITTASASELRQLRQLGRKLPDLDLSRNLRGSWTELDMYSAPDTGAEYDFEGKYKMPSVPCVCAWNILREEEFYPGVYTTKWYITPADAIRLMQWRIFSEVAKSWNQDTIKREKILI
jgi:hypothetical protein